MTAEKNQRTDFELQEFNIQKNLLNQLVTDLEHKMATEKNAPNLTKDQKNLYELGSQLWESMHDFIEPSNPHYKKYESHCLITTMINTCFYALKAFTQPSPDLTTNQSKNNLALLAIAATRLSQFPSVSLKKLAGCAMALSQTAANMNGFTSTSVNKKIDVKSPLIKELNSYLTELAPQGLATVATGVVGYIKRSGVIVGRAPSILTLRENTPAIKNIKSTSAEEVAARDHKL